MTHAATFRFYGDLNDFLPAQQRRRELQYAFFGTPSVKDAIEAIGVPHTELALVLVNGEPAALDYRLAPGDRVSVFPQFSELALSPVLSVARPAPPLRFILDGHLGRLAHKLRMLGFDVSWESQPDDEALARASAAEGRLLLTRDVGLLKRSRVTHGYWVRSTSPTEQLVEVGRRFALEAHARPFTRCLRCNGLLAQVGRDEIAQLVPPRVLERQQEFLRCGGCGHLYWRGTHVDRMLEAIQELLRRLAPVTAP